jgi:hypothetical protein
MNELLLIPLIMYVSSNIVITLYCWLSFIKCVKKMDLMHVIYISMIMFMHSSIARQWG